MSDVESPPEAQDSAPRAPRAPLVATPARWVATSLGLACALALAVEGFLAFTHSARTAASFARPLGFAAIIGALLVFAILRAEESRLARELRTARTGTPVLRAMVARRRLELPFLARWSSTKLGIAAVLLADGDREAALDALAASSMVMRGGRLDRLRVLVEADLERKTGNSVGLDRCVQQLRAFVATGNREADLYRLHVLVKAILEQGDAPAGDELARELGSSGDDEARVYSTWLRVWFDLDAGGDESASWPALSEGELRIALLAARTHGAESLVSKLTGPLVSHCASRAARVIVGDVPSR